MRILTDSLLVLAVVPFGVFHGVLASEQNCCSLLRARLGDKVLLASESDIARFIEPYWAAQPQEMSPSCVVQPTAVSDVSEAVKILACGFEAGLSGCDFAIRSGGHTPAANQNNINDGVTLDLTFLNQVTLANNSMVSVGPGNRWEDVYSVLDSHNMTVVGGRSRTVGVGGLVMSGGMSFFSPRYGMACDNVINYEVVLSNAEVVNVNASSFPDLFKALKGGANNFGVVTRLDLRAFSQGPFWGGMATYNNTAVPRLLEFLSSYSDSAGYDEYSQLTLNYGTFGNTSIVMTQNHYTKPEVPPESVFGALSSLQTGNTFRVDTMLDFAVELGSINDNGTIRKAFGTGTYKNSLQFHQRFADLANDTMKELGSTVDQFIVSLQPFGQYITAHSRETGGNFLGLEAADGDRVLYCLTVAWHRKEDDDTVYGAMKNLLDRARDEAEELGLTDDYIFQNYAPHWVDVYGGAGTSNRRALREISTKYDPIQLFQKAVPGGFKL